MNSKIYRYLFQKICSLSIYVFISLCLTNANNGKELHFIEVVWRALPYSGLTEAANDDDEYLTN